MLYTVRVMRALTAIGVCAEYGPGQYSPTPVTKEFADGLGDGVKALSVVPYISSTLEGKKTDRSTSDMNYSFPLRRTLFKVSNKQVSAPPRKRKRLPFISRRIPLCSNG